MTGNCPTMVLITYFHDELPSESIVYQEVFNVRSGGLIDEV